MSPRSGVRDDRSVLQAQAKALGDPTRHHIFRYVADAGRPVDVIELTGELGLHHNAIRQHLAKLLAAGLVVERSAQAAGRGRPRLLYSPAPGIDSRWGVIGPYERLSTLLAEIIRTGDPPLEVGERAGRRAHREDAATPSTDAVSALAEEMERQGFDPIAQEHDGDVEITLRACPFVSAAMVDPATVCDLHLGLARGIASSIGGVAVDDLVPHDPQQAQCVLRGHLEEG